MGNVTNIGKKPGNGPFVVSVTSGKGGVGKTLTTVNMAVAARRSGYDVLILDGDLGLANVDVVLGLSCRYHLRDVLDGHARLSDIVVEGPLGIKVIPSGSGIASLTRLGEVQKQRIFDEIEGFAENFDVLIIDTGAGISDTVLSFNMTADRMVVVTTPEPHAMTDAYALIKVMAEENDQNSFHLVVNQTKSDGEGLKVHERIAEVAKRFLDVRVEFLGSVPFDPQVPKSVMQRRAASEDSTFTVAGQAWNRIARKLLEDGRLERRKSCDVQDFWRNLLWAEPPRRTGAGIGY